MTEKEEEYVHFVSSIKDLNNAWRLLQEIKQCESSSLVAAAFRFALTEYSKPYKISHGNTKRHSLKEEHVPCSYRELHKRILDARDQIHAHSDLTVMEAKLYVKNTPHGKISGTVQNKIVGTEEFSNIDKIIDLIEKTLESMYVQEKLLEQELPFSS
jgi:hypothetical protein